MIWPAIISPVLGLLERIIPDPQAREEAKQNLLKLEGQQALQETQAQLSAIIAEAQSQDPWTSRARPAFLYVVYILLLASIPMGALAALQPDAARAVTEGFKAWLAAIPEPIITLFGVGYLGYAGARTFDKWKGK
jgi:hypothetical protein